MSTKIINGTTAQSVASQMSNPAEAMPTQTLAENNILLAQSRSAEATEAPATRSTYADKGIANTTANVQTLAETIDLFEPEYQSANPLHTVPHLVILYTQAMMFLSKVAAKVNLNKVAIDNRHLLFDDLRQFATRFINALTACGASKDTVKNARIFVNKLDGKRVVKITPEEEDQKHISVSQQSYVQQVQHFEGLIIIAQDEPLYDPPTADLQLLALQTRLTDMIEANKQVTKSQAELNVTRMQRNAFFNAPVTGVVDVCLGVKNNVKAIFGATSAQYKMISSLAFLRIKGR